MDNQLETDQVMQLALFGDPVMHSLSPRIHTAFAQQFNVALNYQRILTAKGELSKNLALFKKAGGLGGNITVPIKAEAFQLCDRHTATAQQAQAVNTFWWEKDKLIGHNTDGQGFLNYLAKHLDVSPEGKSILMLGAGGAASALAAALANQPLERMWIINRDIHKAEFLAEMSDRYLAFDYEQLEEMAESPAFDWVINATSCSLQNKVPKIAGRWLKEAMAMDLSYCGGEPTCFMTWALQQSAKDADDGLGMLVEQAALAFTAWCGEQPDTYPVLSNLRSRE